MGSVKARVSEHIGFLPSREPIAEAVERNCFVVALEKARTEVAIGRWESGLGIDRWEGEEEFVAS